MFFILKSPELKLLYFSLQRTKLAFPYGSSQLIFPVIQCLMDKGKKGNNKDSRYLTKHKYVILPPPNTIILNT